MRYRPRWAAVALLGAAVFLPWLLGRAGFPEARWLPVNFVVLVAGLGLGWLPGLVVGVLAPPARYLLTGHLPALAPLEPLRSLELGVYGLVAGAGRGLGLGPWAATAAAVVLGRLALAGALWLTGPDFAAGAPLAYVGRTALEAWPGLVVQLLLAPPVAGWLDAWARGRSRAWRRGVFRRRPRRRPWPG